MKHHFACLTFGAILLAGLVLNVRPLSAQGTAFTYQGRLSDGANPATGSYDLTFGVWPAAAGSAQVGGTLVSTKTAVSNGLFTVTLDFGAGIFTGADRWLELGVRTNGTGSFTALAPRQRITPTPYAITAGAVTGPINGGAIVNGSIAGAQLATGAAAANLNAAGQSAVPSGGVILSLVENAALVNAGYVRIGALSAPAAWLPRADPAPTAARRDHSAVWTGTEMIVWGGYSGSSLNDDGWVFNLVANTWRAITTVDAPSPRSSHTAVWTGTVMVVWGGYGGGYLKSGGRYDPVRDSWTPVTTVAAPAPRQFHTAVWTGSEMIIWGGNGGGYLNSGGRYDPVHDNWTATTVSGAPSGRENHTAVWAGSEMIVWGGLNGGTINGGYLNDGGRYSLADNSWTGVSIVGAPGPRQKHTAVWTGSEMIIWGGINTGVGSPNGHRYTPVNDSWSTVNTDGSPRGLGNEVTRYLHTVVWTGSEMIVWGGYATGRALGTGGRYNPKSDAWTTMAPEPAARYAHTAVWTGKEMIVWGGYNNVDFNDTFSYTPGGVLQIYQRP